MLGIHDAVRHDDDITLKKLISENIKSVNSITGDMRNTPLHIASSQGHYNAAKILLESGADHKIPNKRGALPIHLAATYNHQNVLELLISHDSSQLNIQEKSGNTSLHISVWKRRPEIVEYLMKQNARVDLSNKDGNKVYHMAVLWNRPYILKMLLRHSTHYINDLNNAGYSALHLAAMKDMEECIQCLLIFNASPHMFDKFGNKPDQYGNEYTKAIFIKFKLYTGIKSSCMSGMAPILAMRKYLDDSSALHIVASFSDSTNLIQQLISNGSNVNARDTFGHTPLYYALQSGCFNNIRAMVSSGGDTSYLHMENELTPLHVAIQRNDLKLAEFLVKHRANVNAIDKSGDTPLLYAIVNHFRHGVQLLLQYGATVTNTDNHGNTPLHLSVTANNYQITKDLLDITTENINSYNSYGHTPLMCAILGRNAKLTKLLLDHGAYLHMTDNNGKSSLTLALDTNFDSMIQVVISYEEAHDNYEKEKTDEIDKTTEKRTVP